MCKPVSFVITTSSNIAGFAAAIRIATVMRSAYNHPLSSAGVRFGLPYGRRRKKTVVLSFNFFKTSTIFIVTEVNHVSDEKLRSINNQSRSERLGSGSAELGSHITHRAIPATRGEAKITDHRQRVAFQDHSFNHMPSFLSCHYIFPKSVYVDAAWKESQADAEIHAMQTL